MSPAALKRALDPAYIGSPFAQPFQFFDGDVSTPMDLTGRVVVLFLYGQGRVGSAAHEIAGVVQAQGLVLFSVADTSAWIKDDYSIEVRLDGMSVVVGRISVAKGAGANGADMVGAAQPPTAPGVVISGSGVVQVVSVAPSAATDPSAIILPSDLSAALGGAETLADALLWLAQNGGTPSPIQRELIGGVVISSVATGALSVAAAGQVLLSGAISSASSATGSLTVGSASSIALVGSAVSTSSLTGAMTVVTQIALAGTAAGSSAAAGSLTVEAPSEVTVLATRMFGPGHGQTTSTSTSTGSATTTSLTCVNESGAALSKVSLAYVGWALQAAGIGVPGNAIPITGATIEYPSGTVVGTFTRAAASSWSIANNSDAIFTDQITLATPIPAGASFVVRSVDQVPNGQKRIHNGGLAGVMTTAMSNTLKKARVFAIGDSIMTQDARGAVLLAGAGKCPVLQISIGGTRASSYVGAANDKLAKLAKDVGCTHSISNMGTNDHGNNQTEATTAAALADEKRAFEAQGLSHWWATTLAQQYFAPLAVVSAVVDSAAEPVLTVTVSEATAARMETEMAYTISGDTNGAPNLNQRWWLTKTGPTTWTAPAPTDRAGQTGAGTLVMAPSGGNYSSTVALVPSGAGMATPTPATSIRAAINARGRAGEFGNLLEWADHFETARDSGINVTRQDQPNAYHADNLKVAVATGLTPSSTRFTFAPSTFSNRAQGGAVIFLTGAQRGRTATASGSGVNDVTVFSGLTAPPVVGDQFVIIPGSSPWATDGVHPSLTAPPGGAQTRLIDINKAWLDILLAA